MKQKMFTKKLTLNKKTVAHLNGNQMNAARGGYGETCPGECRIFVTEPDTCSGGGATGTCGCGTAVSECASFTQKLCTSHLADTCC